jgi:hypothetical protein
MLAAKLILVFNLGNQAKVNLNISSYQLNHANGKTWIKLPHQLINLKLLFETNYIKPTKSCRRRVITSKLKKTQTNVGHLEIILCLIVHKFTCSLVAKKV